MLENISAYLTSLKRAFQKEEEISLIINNKEYFLGAETKSFSENWHEDICAFCGKKIVLENRHKNYICYECFKNNLNRR